MRSEFAIPDSLREQLAELKLRDPSLKVFGASTHRYRSVRVSPDEVARLEAALGISLPREYRRFLLDIGYGAGPYYGIWSPEESLTEIQGLFREYEAEEGKPLRTASQFPLTADDLSVINAKFAAGDKSPAFESDWPCNGCLPICHHGCTFWTVLILSGEFIGRVWDVACFVGYSGEWLPARRPTGWWEIGMPHPTVLARLTTPPTFGEWYAGWMERCRTDLSK